MFFFCETHLFCSNEVVSFVVIKLVVATELIVNRSWRDVIRSTFVSLHAAKVVIASYSTFVLHS